MKPDTKLLLVGCGKMGGALLQRLADKVTACVIEPSGPAPALKTLPGITWLTDAGKIDPAFQPTLIVIAVKPQQMTGALPAYARFKNSAFLSIAAGVPLAALEKYLGENAAIVRAMPNLPASVGEGMSAAVANKNVAPAQRDVCDEALRAVGETVWLTDEKLMDAVTALSGSGPAYIFALCEAMARAGVALGFTEEIAMKLARQTVIGSSALLAQSTEDAAALRKAVTSPGGTTEAALQQLLARDGIDDLMQRAIKAAYNRGRELAQLA